MAATIEPRYYIGLLSAPHILFLAILIPLAIIIAYFISRKFGFTKTVVWICLVIGILCELDKIFFFVEETPGGYRLPAEHLPFNLCPFQIFLMFALAVSADVKKRTFLLAYMYPTMVAGAAFAMFVPSVVVHGYHGLLDFATYRYFFYHGMLVFLGFYLYMSKPIQFGIKSFGAAVLGISLVTIIIVWLNAFFGWDPAVNFFFLVRPPADNLPFLNLDRGWPVYMFNIMWICVMLFFFCYIKDVVRAVAGLLKRNRGR